MAFIILLIKIDYVYICVHKAFMVIGQQNNVFLFVQMVLSLKMVLIHVYLIVLMVHLLIIILICVFPYVKQLEINMEILQ
jgi:hypothetical protein